MISLKKNINKGIKMVESVASVGKKSMDFVTKMVSSNRRFIEGF